MFFWNSLASLMIQQMMAICSLVSLPFLKSVCIFWCLQFMYCWNLAGRILSITLLVCEKSTIGGSFNILWHCPSLGLEWKLICFYSSGYCWVFQICWHIECNTLTASSFRIWNSSTGIPSPPLTLFLVLFPRAHLTLHSSMSGSRWVIIPSWLSGPWRSFLVW